MCLFSESAQWGVFLIGIYEFQIACPLSRSLTRSLFFLFFLEIFFFSNSMNNLDLRDFVALAAALIQCDWHLGFSENFSLSSRPPKILQEFKFSSSHPGERVVRLKPHQRERKSRARWSVVYSITRLNVFVCWWFQPKSACLLLTTFSLSLHQFRWHITSSSPILFKGSHTIPHQPRHLDVISTEPVFSVANLLFLSPSLPSFCWLCVKWKDIFILCWW